MKRTRRERFEIEKDRKGTKERSASQRGVRPRRARAPVQELYAAREDQARGTTPVRESLTLGEPGKEQQSTIRRSRRVLEVDPVPPVMNSAKRAGTTPNLLMKTPLVRPLGLSSVGRGSTHCQSRNGIRCMWHKG